MLVTKKQVTQLSYDITAFAIKVHKNLEPGLLESIYETCLKFELERNGYSVKQQVIADVVYDVLLMETTLKLDLLVNDLVVVEFKTVEELKPVHQAQLLTYMKLLQKPQGLLINFFTDNIIKSMKPFVNEYFTSLPD